MAMNNKLAWAIVIVYMICNLVSSMYLIFFQIDQANQRIQASEKAAKERQEIKNQNEFLVCILQTPAEKRTDLFIEQCRNQTLSTKK